MSAAHGRNPPSEAISRNDRSSVRYNGSTSVRHNGGGTIRRGSAGTSATWRGSTGGRGDTACSSTGCPPWTGVLPTGVPSGDCGVARSTRYHCHIGLSSSDSAGVSSAVSGDGPPSDVAGAIHVFPSGNAVRVQRPSTLTWATVPSGENRGVCHCTGSW
ncbi:hypothetical protein GCM10025787_02570 [Saccharopolyspora rosea]